MIKPNDKQQHRYIQSHCGSPARPSYGAFSRISSQGVHVQSAAHTMLPAWG